MPPDNRTLGAQLVAFVDEISESDIKAELAPEEGTSVVEEMTLEWRAAAPRVEGRCSGNLFVDERSDAGTRNLTLSDDKFIIDVAVVDDTTSLGSDDSTKVSSVVVVTAS